MTSYYEMKYGKLICTWVGADVKVHLELVRFLSRVRKQKSWKLVSDNLSLYRQAFSIP